MNTNRDVDSAIDHVAKRMVAVPDDPEMVARIVSALPERSSRLGWLIPQLAALGAIVIAALVWSTRERPALPALLPSTDVVIATAFRDVIAAREPGTPLRTQPLERLELLERLEPLGSDFDRSLPALDTLGALELTVIETRALPSAEALTLAPIEIGELPLTAETISPNKF
jgi:hypothetical protein